jgi:hypothetical protein
MILIHHKPRIHSHPDDKLYSVTVCVGKDGYRKVAHQASFFAHCGECARVKFEPTIKNLRRIFGARIEMLSLIRISHP